MNDIENRIETCIRNGNCATCEYYAIGCTPEQVLQTALDTIRELKIKVNALQIRNQD